MIDSQGIADVVGVVLTTTLVLAGIGVWLRSAYRAQEAEQLSEIISRRKLARRVLQTSPVARTASRK